MLRQLKKSTHLVIPDRIGLQESIMQISSATRQADKAGLERTSETSGPTQLTCFHTTQVQAH